LITLGWGKSWGIYVTASRPAGIEDVRRQLRQFLLVKSPAGKKLFFRYYDPRVMRAYLPTCDDNAYKLLFNPIVKYVMEDESAQQVLSYDLQNTLTVATQS